MAILIFPKWVYGNKISYQNNQFLQVVNYLVSKTKLFHSQPFFNKSYFPLSSFLCSNKEKLLKVNILSQEMRSSSPNQGQFFHWQSMEVTLWFIISRIHQGGLWRHGHPISTGTSSAAWCMLLWFCKRERPIRCFI